MGVPKKQIIITDNSCGGLMTLMLFAKYPDAADMVFLLIKMFWKNYQKKIKLQ